MWQKVARQPHVRLHINISQSRVVVAIVQIVQMPCLCHVSTLRPNVSRRTWSSNFLHYIFVGHQSFNFSRPHPLTPAILALCIRFLPSNLAKHDRAFFPVIRSGERFDTFHGRPASAINVDFIYSRTCNNVYSIRSFCDILHTASRTLASPYSIHRISKRTTKISPLSDIDLFKILVTTCLVKK